MERSESQTLDKCLDINNETNTNGTPLQLFTCNGGGYQSWVPQPDGSIRNPTTARYIDSPGGATGYGTRLQIYDCNGATARKFHHGVNCTRRIVPSWREGMVPRCSNRRCPASLDEAGVRANSALSAWAVSPAAM